MACTDLHLVIHKWTDGQMNTWRDRGEEDGGDEEGRALTSCCPGKQLDGPGCCSSRQEDQEQKGE